MKFKSIKSDRIPIRLLIAFMMFTACFMGYIFRSNISINLIAMVEPTISSKNISHVPECAANSISETEGNSSRITLILEYGEKYNWDSNAQGLILGSYFWGYTIFSLPAGFFAEKYGPTKIICLSILLSGVLTSITPFLAPLHYGCLIGTRIFIGGLGALIYPSIHNLISKWSPPLERGKFAGTLLGGALGTVVVWPLLGAIMKDLGWAWSFFIQGAITISWSLLWWHFVTDSPVLNRRISEKERTFIMTSHGGSISECKKNPPYKEIFTSIPFWALTFLHVGNLWGLYLFLTSGPKYMSEVLGLDIDQLGFFASIPHLFRMIFGFLFGLIGDYLIKTEKLSVTGVRKIFVIFSHILPGIMLYAQSFIGCNIILAIIFPTLALGMNGASTITNLLNAQDLSPNFAGTIYGIVSCIGGTTGFISPLVTSYFTSEKNGLQEWKNIFYIGSAMYIGSGIIFFIFGSAEEQPWNKIENNQKPKDTKPDIICKCEITKL